MTRARRFFLPFDFPHDRVELKRLRRLGGNEWDVLRKDYAFQVETLAACGDAINEDATALIQVGGAQ